jgi:hypothetical protein
MIDGLNALELLHGSFKSALEPVRVLMPQKENHEQG